MTVREMAEEAFNVLGKKAPSPEEAIKSWARPIFEEAARYFDYEPTLSDELFVASGDRYVECTFTFGMYMEIYDGDLYQMAEYLEDELELWYGTIISLDEDGFLQLRLQISPDQP